MILLGLKVLAFSVEEVDSGPPFIYFLVFLKPLLGPWLKKKLKGFMFLLRQNYFIQEFFGEIHHNKTKSWTCYSQSGYPHRFPLLPLLIDETVIQWDTLIYNSISHSIGWRCEFSADLGIHHCLTKSHQIMTLECQKLPKKINKRDYEIQSTLSSIRSRETCTHN